MVLVRFAPSPTGNLHVGNMRTALVNFLFARANRGKFMLRIDDTDDERSTREFEESICDDLKWMGIKWDEQHKQSERIAHYQAALKKLLASGRAYKCFETQEELSLKRKSQRAAGKPPVYDRTALKLSDAEIAEREANGEKPHYRFKLNHEDTTWNDLVRGQVSIAMSSLSDPVILRADGRVIYTLASVVDDIDYKITHIMRGEDHTTNSAAQIQLFEALGGAVPEMGHFALLAGADGESLSKRLGSFSIGALRDEGIEAMTIASLLARIGTADVVVPQVDMGALIKGFDISRFGRATPRFDNDYLKSLNKRILALTDYSDIRTRFEEIIPNLEEMMSKIDVPKIDVPKIDVPKIDVPKIDVPKIDVPKIEFKVTAEDFWRAIRNNITTLAEVQEICDMITKPIVPKILDKDMLNQAARLLPEGAIDASTWSHWTQAIMEETGLKGKSLFKPLRLALTGAETGPEMANLLPLMGRERVIARLNGDKA